MIVTPSSSPWFPPLCSQLTRRQTWCCHHFQRGCAATTLSTTLPYDCHLVFFFWQIPYEALTTFQKYSLSVLIFLIVKFWKDQRCKKVHLPAILSDVPSSYCQPVGNKTYCKPCDKKKKAINQSIASILFM